MIIFISDNGNLILGKNNFALFILLFMKEVLLPSLTLFYLYSSFNAKCRLFTSIASGLFLLFLSQESNSISCLFCLR